MTDCERITAEAAGLASLPADDPERIAAFAHARTCPACARALAEGAALMSLLELGAPAAAPAPEAISRAAAEIRRDLQRRPGSAAKATTAVALAVAAAWLVALASGRKWLGHGGAAASVLVAAVAALTTAGAMAVWSPLLGALPLASFVASIAGGTGGPLQAGIGVRCFGMELAVAAVPLVVAYLFARRRTLEHASRMMAAAAAGGALAGQAALEITCHAARTHAHLLAFHTGAVVVALLAGSLLGTRLRPAAR
jgi:hypothetical protein